MKVLHLTKVQGIGGAERHLLTLLPALRERGIDAQFLSLDAGRDAQRFHDALDALGIPWHRVRTGLDISPRLGLDVVRAVRAERPDLLHTHMVHADAYGSLAARAQRVPFVSTRHNDDRYLLGAFRYVDRTLMLGARRIVAISDAVRAFHIRAGLPAGKLETIHYGLEQPPATPSERTPEELGIEPGTPLVVAVGRLIPQKDHATLLAAFKRVHDARPDARLALLGWGPLEQRLKQQAATLGIGDAVLITGRLEPRDWLSRADVFAHTSRWEGFGLVLLEAMLSSLPIVATRASAVPEIVADGETGLLADIGDAGTIAAHLGVLLEDPELRARLGQAGLDRARSEFSVERMTTRTISVYERAVG